MSKVKIQGNASGTGVVTLTAPNTNTDRTITLPDSTGSILDSTSTLDATKLSGALPAIDGSSLTGVVSGLGVSQSWTNVLASRAYTTNYTNSTGKSIEVVISLRGDSGTSTLTVDGVAVGLWNMAGGTASTRMSLSATIPAGSVYSVSSSSNTLQNWAELR